MDNKETKKLAKTPDDEDLGGVGEAGVVGPSALGDSAGEGVVGVVPGEPKTVMASF